MLSLITFKGKNVALPKLFFFKYDIASLALSSLSTTMKLALAPSETFSFQSNQTYRKQMPIYF